MAEPERELRRLCEYVGEAYEPGMLHDRGSATSVAAAHEWWKGDATGPIDGGRSGRWRSEMPAAVQRYAALNLGDILEEHGYGKRVPAARVLAIVPSGDALNARYDGVLLRLADAGVAIRRPIPRTIEELHLQEPLVFFGVIGQLEPDRDGPALRRVVDIVRLGSLLLTRRLQGRPVIWVRRLSLIRRHTRDGGERFVARMLKVLAVSREAEDLPALVGISTDGGETIPPAQPG